MTQEETFVVELVEQLLNIEHERTMLNEQQKELFEEYEDKLDVKAVKAAIRIAKIRAKTDASDETLNSMVGAAGSKLGF